MPLDLQCEECRAPPGRLTTVASGIPRWKLSAESNLPGLAERLAFFRLIPVEQLCDFFGKVADLLLKIDVER